MEHSLPDGWEISKISEITNVRKQRAIANLSPYIEIGDVDVVTKIYKLKDKKSVENSLVAKKDDVLISRVRPTRGAVSIIKEAKLYASSAFTIIEAKNKLLPKYLFYSIAFNPKFFDSLKRNEKGTSYPSCRENDILNFKINLPPLETQKKIVYFLEKAEQLKECRKEADELTKDFLKSIFLKMFGEGISKKSNHTFLEDVSTRITDGEHATPKRVNKGMYLLSARNILNHEVTLKDVDYIGEEEYERISRRILPRIGDVLVSCSGTVGRVTRVKEKIKFQMVRSVALIRSNAQKVNPIYLEYFFESEYMKSQIARSINQSSQANLFQGKIKKLKLYLPPIELQNKFASIVKEVEAMKEQQKHSKNQIDDLFNALIQKAFKGDVIA
ncbi:restriction endonuclease subunit S [Halobacteriota archaeon]